MVADNFREQPLRVRQSKELFGKSVKRGFTQILRLRCNALNGSAASDKPVCSLAPISLFVVGGAVLKALDFMLLLHKLPLECFLFGLQFFNFFFGHDFDLLTDKWIEKDRLRFR